VRAVFAGHAALLNQLKIQCERRLSPFDPMSSSDPRIYLLHIRDCCEELIQCLAQREQRSGPVSIVFNAACRNL